MTPAACLCRVGAAPEVHGPEQPCKHACAELASGGHVDCTGRGKAPTEAEARFGSRDGPALRLCRAVPGTLAQPPTQAASTASRPAVNTLPHSLPRPFGGWPPGGRATQPAGAVTRSPLSSLGAPQQVCSDTHRAPTRPLPPASPQTAPAHATAAARSLQVRWELWQAGGGAGGGVGGGWQHTVAAAHCRRWRRLRRTCERVCA